MKDHQDEIDKGRVVEAWMTKEGAENMLSGDAVYPHISPDKGGDIDQRVFLILPPKPLEITGWVCDAIKRQGKSCSPRHKEFDIADCCIQASKGIMEELNCRPVILVEKGASCQCESQ